MGFLKFRKKRTEITGQTELTSEGHAEPTNAILEEFLQKEPYKAANHHQTRSGLYPHEILILDHAASFYTDQMEFPSFWRLEIGILDMPRELFQLVDHGFLTEASIEETLQGQTVQTLKSILRKSSLPLGGKKAELIERLLSSLKEHELYGHFPRRRFSVTWDGIRALDEAKYITYIAKFPVDGLTIWDIHRKVTEYPEKPFRDLIWAHMELLSAQYHKAENFSAYRNLRYRMYTFRMEEKKRKRAFPFLAEVFFYDLSGVESTADPLLRYISGKHFFPYNKSQVKLSAKNVQAMQSLQKDLGLSDEMLKALLLQFFGQFSIPSHLFTKEECVVVVLLELYEDYDRLHQLYEFVQKRFEEQY